MAIDGLLEQLPENHRQAINRYQEIDLNTPIRYKEACLWPDAVRKWDRYKAVHYWHVISVERHTSTIGVEDCLSGCLLSAIDWHSSILRSKHASVWAKTQALMFLGHWIGDIHQPLHVSFREGAQGSDIAVNGQDNRCTSLHSVWDKCMLRSLPGYESEWSIRLLREITPGERDRWERSTVLEWANESFLLAKKAAIGVCNQAIDSVNCLATENGKETPHLLPANYYQTHLPVIRQRIQQAAVRLAATLDRLMDDERQKR